MGKIRLIDDTMLTHCIACVICNTKEELAFLNFVVDLISQQPTAYDIDKVVEELYMHSVEEKIPSCLTHRIIDVEEAIEIVKKGGRGEKNDKL